MSYKIIMYLFLIVNIGEVMAEKKDVLKTYRKRRDLTISPEPKGTVAKKRSKKPIFVIQKHAASHLHYDFRLEIDGILVSWAVPKGPSMNPKEKRLAMRTDDHPMEYAKFEGMIPEGTYGAGTVMIWDYGTYKNIKKKNDKLVPMTTCLKNGQIEIFLYGKKLKGGYALHRFKPKEDAWLLIKMNDEYASARRNPTNTENKSARTNRTMNEIKKEES
ncbi:MAG: DNA polymerase ligase N-terminal domain-containing protein [Candidatus Babeliales bacterium]